jgi:hypothetical protein
VRLQHDRQPPAQTDSGIGQGTDGKMGKGKSGWRSSHEKAENEQSWPGEERGGGHGSLG